MYNCTPRSISSLAGILVGQPNTYKDRRKQVAVKGHFSYESQKRKASEEKIVLAVVYRGRDSSPQLLSSFWGVLYSEVRAASWILTARPEGSADIPQSARGIHRTVVLAAASVGKCSAQKK